MRFVSINLKQYDVAGFQHTEENINMTMMFQGLKNDLRKDELKPKQYTSKKSSVSIEHRGKHAYKIYEDKVNMGNPRSDMIPYIREYLLKEKQEKKK